MPEEDKCKKELETSRCPSSYDRRDSSRKSNVSPTETAQVVPWWYLVLTVHTTKPERQGFRCHDEHSTVKTRERSCLSQERLEQLMHVRMSDVSRSNITEKQLLLWVSFWYETKARPALFTWIPQLSSLIRSLTSSQEMITYLESLLHNKTWRNTRLQLSKLLKMETSSIIFHLFQVISNHRKKKHRNFHKLLRKLPRLTLSWRKPQVYYETFIVLSFNITIVHSTMIISDLLFLFYVYKAAKRQRQVSTSSDDGV